MRKLMLEAGQLLPYHLQQLLVAGNVRHPFDEIAQGRAPLPQLLQIASYQARDNSLVNRLSNHYTGPEKEAKAQKEINSERCGTAGQNCC